MNNKNYDEWNILKKKINFIYNNPFHAKVREVWWVNIGLNIGSEIYGKGFYYVRPVLVIKVDDKRFIGLPLSSKIKKSKNTIRIYTDDLKYHSVILNQVKTFDNKRLVKRKYILSRNVFKKLVRKFKNMITADY